MPSEKALGHTIQKDILPPDLLKKVSDATKNDADPFADIVFAKRPHVLETDDLGVKEVLAEIKLSKIQGEEELPGYQPRNPIDREPNDELAHEELSKITIPGEIGVDEYQPEKRERFFFEKDKTSEYQGGKTAIERSRKLQEERKFFAEIHSMLDKNEEILKKKITQTGPTVTVLETNVDRPKISTEQVSHEGGLGLDSVAQEKEEVDIFGNAILHPENVWDVSKRKEGDEGHGTNELSKKKKLRLEDVQFADGQKVNFLQADEHAVLSGGAYEEFSPMPLTKKESQELRNKLKNKEGKESSLDISNVEFSGGKVVDFSKPDQSIVFEKATPESKIFFASEPVTESERREIQKNLAEKMKEREGRQQSFFARVKKLLKKDVF